MAGQKLSLASLKDDLQSLLEEIYTQHSKKVHELGFWVEWVVDWKAS